MISTVYVPGFGSGLTKPLLMMKPMFVEFWYKASNDFSQGDDEVAMNVTKSVAGIGSGLEKPLEIGHSQRLFVAVP